MFEEIKKYIAEAEGSRKLSSVLIYQDNIEEVAEDIDSAILQIRSLMETNTIQQMIDDKVIDPNNFEFARDSYELIYKKLFDIKNDLDETKQSLAQLLDKLHKKSGSAPTQVTDKEGSRKDDVVHSESMRQIANYINGGK